MKIINVLIIDQDSFELEVLFKRLQKRGLTVKACTDLNQAYEITDKFMPDVILVEPWNVSQNIYLDIENLKIRFPKPRIIVLTSQVSQDRARQVMAKGAFDFMIKPCPAEDLLAAIRRAANVF